MTQIESRIVRKNGYTTITAVIDGEPYNTTETHPNFSVIRDYLESESPDAERLRELFDVEGAVRARFEKVSERVSIKNGAVLLDYEPINTSLTRQILRFYENGLDFSPLVAFFEKVQANPQAHSREQLYDWLSRRDFTITQNGDFLAYKSVVRNEEHGFVSVSHGPAIVNGVEHTNGRVPNPLGATVELARNTVDFNPGVACSVGLHAGTFEYARDFSGDALVKVRINPRDVVSVPSDTYASKLRVCRYVVLEETELPYAEPLYTQPNLPLDYDEQDEEREDVVCIACGEVGHENEDDPACEYYDEEEPDEDEEPENETEDPAIQRLPSDIGATQKAVYLVLDALGQGTFSDIAKHSDLSRDAVKNAIHRLVIRNLVRSTGTRKNLSKVYEIQ